MGSTERNIKTVLTQTGLLMEGLQRIEVCGHVAERCNDSVWRDAIRARRLRLGREQLIYDMLRQRIRTGEIVNGEPVAVAKLQISDSCKHLISVIPTAPRDEDNREEIAEFLGDDPIQGVGYGLYSMFGNNPNRKPLELRVQERVQEFAERVHTTVENLDPHVIETMSRRAERLERPRFQHGGRRRGRIWHPQSTGRRDFVYLRRGVFQSFRPTKARIATVMISKVIPRGW